MKKDMEKRFDALINLLDQHRYLNIPFVLTPEYIDVLFIYFDKLEKDKDYWRRELSKHLDSSEDFNKDFTKTVLTGLLNSLTVCK